MVVHRVPARVVPRIVQGVPGEGDVAHRRVEDPTGHPGVRERLRADRGVRIEGLGDRRGDRVQLHPGHLRPLRGQPDEGAGTGAGLQHPPALETQGSEGAPDLAGDRRVGVVGVDDRPARGRVLGLIQQLVQLRPVGLVLGTGLVEDFRDPGRTPGPPAGQRGALSIGSGPLLGLESAQHAQRGEVGPEACLGSRGGQLVLGAGDETPRTFRLSRDYACSASFRATSSQYWRSSRFSCSTTRSI